MAKKNKMKISKVKRTNQTTNKMKKQGKLKHQRHRPKVQKQKQPSQPQVEYSSESESASGEEWADMMDAEEQDYILSRLAKQPQLLSNVPEKDVEDKSKSRKRKKVDKGKMPKQRQHSDSGAESNDDSGSEVEYQYEKELSEQPPKKMKPLLPIKTKEGVVERAEEVEDTDSEQEGQEKENQFTNEIKEDLAAESESDSGVDGTVEENEADGEVISTIQLLAARRDRLNNDKLRIGALCSSLLECPEKKLKNFFPILYLMEERLKDGALNLHSVRKLATLSAFEVFKDILPDYYIRHQDYSNVKLKKDTLALYKYEKELLEFYKRYLQRLEKAAMVLRQKKGDTRKVDEATAALGLVSLRCMCGLLCARAEFNFASNIAQSVVPFLGCAKIDARNIVNDACATVFKQDTKGDITLTVVRLIGQLAKRREDRLHPDALRCLLSLRIRDVDLDEDADLRHKKKQDTKHKKRIVNLSKKEKKRAKKLKEVEKELLETEAQENEVARRKQLTEVTKTVFHIYFRVLKTAPKSKLLAAALEGIAKFTHVINLEYYSDLVAILSRLASDEDLPRSSQLRCVRTALAVLAGTGDALKVDPAVFHKHLHSASLYVHGGAMEDAKIVLEAMSEVISRARHVPGAALRALAKRLCGLATRLPPHAALAALCALQRAAQMNKSARGLLEGEEAGSGRYEPLAAAPELCGAHAAAAHELCTLRRHWHPALRAAAASLLAGGGLPADLAKLSPMQAFEAYDGSQMSFKPAVPPPATRGAAARSPRGWLQPALREHCERLEAAVDMHMLTKLAL